MRDLASLREKESIPVDEQIRWLRALTTQESMLQWLQLQSSFEWQLQQSAPYFESERREALAELQARLRRLIY